MRSAFVRDDVPERKLPPPLEPAWSEGKTMALDEAIAYALAAID